MNAHTFFKITFLTTMFLFISSCDKYQDKKFEGTHVCAVEYDYWGMAPTNIDSTYNEDIQIKREGKNLLVLGHSIDIDELKE